MARNVIMELTPAQLRLINEALALLEADEGEGQFDPRLMSRTRAKIWSAVVSLDRPRS